MEQYPAFLADMQRYGVSLSGRITCFEGSQPQTETCIMLDAAGGKQRVQAAGAYEIAARFTLLSGQPPALNVALDWAFDGWSTANQLFMPAAVYGGNRFPARQLPYPPMLTEPGDKDLQTPVLSDVPRLNAGPGPSRIQLLAGDLATPAIGVHDHARGLGFLLLCGQGSDRGDNSLEVAENAARDRAVLTISQPGVRQGQRYTICDRTHPSPDRGSVLLPGQSLDITVQVHCFPCASTSQLYRRFLALRKNPLVSAERRDQLPFSSAFALQERKYNAQNWVEEAGYYAVGMREVLSQNWQLGWIGGGIASYALLALGDGTTRERALRNLAFIFRDDAITPLGFFYPMGDGRRFFHDGHEIAQLRGLAAIDAWDLVRKQGGALYYLLRQFLLLEKQGKAALIPANWKVKLQGCADVLVRLWERHGQLGFYIDGETGDLAVGGSTSGGIVPAGLALAAGFFGKPAYLETARQIASAYHRDFLALGFTNGGPGEAALCPDSESAVGLLTSLVELYDRTGEAQWLLMAEDLAALCATWVMSYDFRFPPESTFGELDQRTCGTVFANAQNKHSAPGICTHSGLALLKLYRVTGKAEYLDLIKDIAHAIPPYLSRDDRPILAAGTPFLGTGTVGGEGTTAADRYNEPKKSDSLRT
jgi:hypothetical protein